MSVWYEYVAGTRGSGIVFNACGVLGMGVVRGMRGVGGVCAICMCLAREVWGEWIIAPYRYLLPTMYTDKYRKSIFVCVWLSDRDESRHLTLL